jgi:hypothetical protein
MYPDAAFVHIVRNPIDVIPSSIRTFRRLYFMQGLQVPRFEELEETVFDQFERLHELVERDSSLIPSSRLANVRYEELIASPSETVARVYEQLELGEFDEVRPKLEQYFESSKDYKRNRHQPSSELQDRIQHRCGPYMLRHGYA